MYIRAAVQNIHDEPSDIKYKLINDKTTRPSILAELAKDPDVYIRIAVASSLNTSADTLVSMLDDTSARVRCAAAANPNIPVDILLALTDDEDPNVRRAAVSNESAPFDAVERHLHDDNVCVRFAAAKRLGRTDEMLINLPHNGICVRDDVTGNLDDDEWMYHVCDGGPTEFEENAIAVTSRGVEFGEPVWWEDTSDILNKMNFNFTNFPKFAEANRGICPEDALEDMYKVAFRYGNHNSSEFLYDAICVLNPQYNFEIVKTTRYASPSEWVACIYDADEIDIDVQALQDWYFGDIYELETMYLEVDDNFFESVVAGDLDTEDLFDIFYDYGTYREDFINIPGSEYRKYRDQGDQALLEHLAELMGVPVDDSVII